MVKYYSWVTLKAKVLNLEVKQRTTELNVLQCLCHCEGEPLTESYYIRGLMV